MRLVAGRGLQDRRVDLDEAARVEPAPQRRLDPRASEQERPPVGVDVGPPPGAGGAVMPGRRSRSSLDRRGRFRGKATADARNHGARLRLLRSRKEHHGEGHCQLAAQGQRRRSRRQALRRPDGAEHPSRQGHAGDPARPAPDQRRGEDLRALPHHRAGRAGLRRIAGAQLPLRGRRGLPLHEPGQLRAGRGAPRT